MKFVNISFCKCNRINNISLYVMYHLILTIYCSFPIPMKTSSYVPSNGSSLSCSNSQRGGTNSRKRIRMSRCGQCVGCNATNCGKCYKCLDMIKYGGPGTLKQACERRQCVNPQMPGVAPLTTPIQYSANSSKGTYKQNMYVKSVQL